MNQDWAEKNRTMQAKLKNEADFREGLDLLLDLRADLFQVITSFVNTLPEEAFYRMPFPNARGYHSKTLAYSMWHIFRIEDIALNTLIKNDEQILFSENRKEKIRSPIITTGNELAGEATVSFSKQLSVKPLYEYCMHVKDSGDAFIKSLEYRDLKRTFTEEDRKRLIESHCVSEEEAAFFLIDYWCGKDLAGLLRMPFSRHWIMHVEAMDRIKNRLCMQARKGVDPVAYCGLFCSHCFLKDRCGFCRTAYNTCSNAACSPDKICPNVKCAQKKELDGCYACPSLDHCTIGFYGNGKDGNAVKALAKFIRAYGKQSLNAVLECLRETYDFQKIQEILGYDTEEGLRILEKHHMHESRK